MICEPDSRLRVSELLLPSIAAVADCSAEISPLLLIVVPLAFTIKMPVEPLPVTLIVLLLVIVEPIPDPPLKPTTIALALLADAVMMPLLVT